jgi:hypothetical protein
MNAYRAQILTLMGLPTFHCSGLADPTVEFIDHRDAQRPVCAAFAPDPMS